LRLLYGKSAGKLKSFSAAVKGLSGVDPKSAGGVRAEKLFPLNAPSVSIFFRSALI
jgi:hypothetical protein